MNSLHSHGQRMASAIPFLGALLCISWTSPCNAASFDCAKASTRVETIVCSNPSASRLDETLSALYRQLKPLHPELRGSQREWLAKRNTCTDEACVVAAYSDRIDELRGLVPAAGSVPVPEEAVPAPDAGVQLPETQPPDAYVSPPVVPAEAAMTPESSLAPATPEPAPAPTTASVPPPPPAQAPASQETVTDDGTPWGTFAFILAAGVLAFVVVTRRKGSHVPAPVRPAGGALVPSKPSGGNEILVHTYQTPDQGSLALMRLDGAVKDGVLAQLNETYRSQGGHIKSGGAMSPKTVLALFGSGGGALGLSAATSGSLFVATANPATLMAIGNGVGSAVMGSGGIVAQAPFLPVAGALMPVVAPLIAFQAVTAAMMLSQFEKVHERLDLIDNKISRILQRSEASIIGEIISSANRLAELEEQFSKSHMFTPSMISRLTHLEDKINPIFERYNYLYGSQKIDSAATLEDLKFKQNDAYLAIVLSILDLRLDVLRLKLAVQEDPGSLEASTNRLKEKIGKYSLLWDEIGRNPKEIELVATELKDAVEDMNIWQRNMPSWLLGKRAVRIGHESKMASLESSSREMNEKFRDDLKNARDSGALIANRLAATSPSNEISLVYWQDSRGEHAYYTSDISLIGGPEANRRSPA